MSRPSERASSPNFPPQPRLDATTREQCLRYLLGELSAPEREQFHSRLVTDEALSDELLQQADLVYQLSTMTPPKSVLPPLMLATASANWGRLSMIASVAAGGVLAIAGWAWQSDRGHRSVPAQGTTSAFASSENDDELRIAQAWVEGPLSLALATENDLDCCEPSDLDESFDPNEDSILHWMMVAASTGENHEG